MEIEFMNLDRIMAAVVIFCANCYEVKLRQKEEYRSNFVESLGKSKLDSVSFFPCTKKSVWIEMSYLKKHSASVKKVTYKKERKFCLLFIQF